MTQKQKILTKDNLKVADVERALSYIDGKWEDLTRYTPEDEATLIGLPFPYVIPSPKNTSGFAFEEMYYWDSYFIAQGLLKYGRPELAEGMLENILFMVKRFGLVPNGSRYYLTGNSQPPLLTSYIMDVFEVTEDKVWLKKAFELAKKEYETTWMSEEHPNWRKVFHGLNRYYDVNVIDALAETESGWDMTTRFDDECLSYTPVDLNCLLYKYELDFAKMSQLLGEDTESEAWIMHAKNRKAKINYYMWDDDKGFFFDYNFKKDKLSDVWSLAGYYAMWSGLASKEQADILVDNLDKFLRKGGLSATSGEGDYIDKHKQWAYPNGWAPLHWITVKGLEKYGYDDFARNIALRWLTTNTEYFAKNGIFREAYNVLDVLDIPEEGLYPPQEGFGWTNGVYLDLVHKYIVE